MYSVMANVSQTVKPSSSTMTGTRLVGVTPAMTRVHSESGVKSKRSLTSSNGMPKAASSTPLRMDQDE
jgi:hypothetical protein